MPRNDRWTKYATHADVTRPGQSIGACIEPGLGTYQSVVNNPVHQSEDQWAMQENPNPKRPCLQERPGSCRTPRPNRLFSISSGSVLSRFLAALIFNGNCMQLILFLDIDQMSTNGSDNDVWALNG